jgi:hypothetical protein
VPAILHLNLHREFFSDIARKEKVIEYRARSPYWCKRLENRKYDVILFRNGYAKDAPEMLVEFRGLRRYGKGRKAYYAILLGKILGIRRWHFCQLVKRKESQDKVSPINRAIRARRDDLESR